MDSVISYFPIVLTMLVALGFVVTTMVVTHKLGPKKITAKKEEAFECGIESQGNARIPFSIKYFLVAILFVLFDVEIIFMYPWAVSLKDLKAEFGPALFIEMLLFVAFVLFGFYYIIKKGALKWE